MLGRDRAIAIELRVDQTGVAEQRLEHRQLVGALAHAFPNGGLTCVLILQESNAVVHTWPETGSVNIDIFSCSSRLKSLAAIDELGRLLGASRISVQEVLRADGHFHAAAQGA